MLKNTKSTIYNISLLFLNYNIYLEDIPEGGDVYSSTSILKDGKVLKKFDGKV